MLDHHDLVAEMPSVERMTTQDRLKHAKKRRSQQLKKFSQYEKHLEKENSKKKKSSNAPLGNKPPSRHRTVVFVPNIALLEAAARKDVEEVEHILKKGVNPDLTNDDGLTALHQCCIDDSEQMLVLLLEYGANVNAKDSEHWTPLHAAATCGHAHLCKHLVDSGADLLAVNADGNMPYDICEDERTLDYIETEMAKRGITQDDIDNKRVETEKTVLKDLQDIANSNQGLEFRDDVGATPLHVAAANGYVEVAEYLLEHNVKVNARDNDSWQPIHAAAYWGQPDLVDILVRHGADIDAKTKTGETPFDLCEDPELKQKILDVKDEIESNKAIRGGKSSSIKHRISTRSASIRRSSLRGDKARMSLKEAKEEALHFGLRSLQDDDDLHEMDEDKENVPATNIDDVEIILESDDQFHGQKDKKLHSMEHERDRTKTKKPSSPPSSHSKNQHIHPQENHQHHPKQQQSYDRTVTEPPVTNAPESDLHSVKSSHFPSELTTTINTKSNISTITHSDTDNKFKESNDNARPSPPTVSRLKTPPTTPVPTKSLPTETQTRAPEPARPPSQYRQPPPISTNSGSTLNDLKRHRAGNRRDTIDAQVQSMFVERANSNWHSPYNSPNDKSLNGHNNNNSPSSYSQETVHRFVAPTNIAIIGEDDKQNCCVLM